MKGQALTKTGMQKWMVMAVALGLAGLACAEDAPGIFTERKATYRSKNGGGANYTMTVPYLEGGDPVVARRINLFVHGEMLNTLPDAPGAAPEVPRLVELETPLESVDSLGIGQHNAGRTVDVSVSASGCGAYCSEGTSSWTFDARTGYPLAPRDLLTPSGQVALGQQMTKLATVRLKREIARLEKALAARKPKLERTVEDTKTQLIIYDGCVDNMYGRDKMYANDPGYTAIGDGKLTFSHGECASHADRALDDLGPFSHTMNADQLRPYLSAYGKYVLLGEGDGRAPAIDKHARYFAGTINGTIPITLYMGNALHDADATDFTDAHYFYDKYKKRIDLTFKLKGNHFELTESDDKNTAHSELRFELKGDTLVGQWSGNGKTYPFQAKAL